jgi:hypothetical protein
MKVIHALRTTKPPMDEYRNPKNEGLTTYAWTMDYRLKIKQHVQQKTNGGDADATKNYN